jgi:pimeloyl-ACP methyl ester carboxylesterase
MHELSRVTITVLTVGVLGSGGELMAASAAPPSATNVVLAKPTAAAWRNRPSWYVVSTNDRMIAPDQEKAMAAQIKAKTTVLPASHVVMLSHPAAVARVIEEAAAVARN